MEDNKIITLLFERNESAISQMTDTFGTTIKSICKRIGLDNFDTDECVNDTMFSVWNKIPPEKPEYLSSFVYKIARRKAIDRLRKYTAEKRNMKIDTIHSELCECIPYNNTIENDFDEKVLVEIINKWLKSLDESSRKIFICRYFFAEPISQISEKTNFSQSNITTKLHRLRKSLKSELNKEGVLNE